MHDTHVAARTADNVAVAQSSRSSVCGGNSCWTIIRKRGGRGEEVIIRLGVPKSRLYSIVAYLRGETRRTFWYRRSPTTRT